MATVEKFPKNEIKSDNPRFSQLKAIVESSFSMNNTSRITSIGEAYELAAAEPGTIVLDKEVENAAELGLPSDAKILVDNGGDVFARTAAARRIFGDDPDLDKQIMKIAKQVIYGNRYRQFYKTEVIVGLDEEFMVKAHLNAPEEHVANLYSWMVNFQPFDAEYSKRYKQSKAYEENDIYVYFDPDFQHPDFPHGLAYFDVLHNTAIILGLQYFGEIKKGTLTLAWATAQRNNYVPCHGGVKLYKQADGSNFVSSFFGLSGSGKSTLTHAKHDNKYDIQVLHDDAFIINKDKKHSIALEPSYYDKTFDYAGDHPEQDYFVVVHNTGVTKDTEGKLAIQGDDLRNGNGRTVKSRYATSNRVDRIDEEIDAIFWIIKDDAFPPLVKINDPELATTFGCTLMTKRSSAENIVSKPTTNLVIEPYANPFRVYPLKDDYENFKELFERGVDCYLVNTGDFMGKEIPKDVTLASIESVVERRNDFEAFGEYEDITYLPIEGFELPFAEEDYKNHINDRLQVRLDWLNDFNANEANVKLPEEGIEKIKTLMN